MSDLLQRQMRFAKRAGEFITWIFAQGLAVTCGEFHRTPEQAALDAQKGSGIINSLHCKSLAMDLMLFRLSSSNEWEWLDKGSEPEWHALGAYWENMDPENCWGGRFSKPDPDHFSITYEGIR